VIGLLILSNLQLLSLLKNRDYDSIIDGLIKNIIVFNKIKICGPFTNYIN